MLSLRNYCAMLAGGCGVWVAFIAPFWTKPPAKRAQPYNRPIINMMNTAGHLGSQLFESHSDYSEVSSV